jgi:hypothetical protein
MTVGCHELIFGVLNVKQRAGVFHNDLRCLSTAAAASVAFTKPLVNYGLQIWLTA